MRATWELRRHHRVYTKRIHVAEAELLAQFEAAVANMEMPTLAILLELVGAPGLTFFRTALRGS